MKNISAFGPARLPAVTPATAVQDKLIFVPVLESVELLLKDTAIPDTLRPAIPISLTVIVDEVVYGDAIETTLGVVRKGGRKIIGISMLVVEFHRPIVPSPTI